MLSFEMQLEPGQDDAFRWLRPGDVTGCLKQLAARYLRLQRERIKAGVDADGNDFVPYAHPRNDRESYGQKKARAGRKTDPPDLRLTGQMLRSQAVVAKEGGDDTVVDVEFHGMHARAYFKRAAGKKGDSLVVSVSSAEGSSNAIVAAGVDSRRPFVGVSEAEADELGAQFLECLLVKSETRGLQAGVDDSVVVERE